MFRTDLGARQEELEIGMGLNVLLLQWLRETRPAGAGVVLVERAKQRLTGNDIHINAMVFIVPVFIAIGWFSAFVLRHLILHRRQLLPQFGIGRFDKGLHNGLPRK